MRLPGGTAVATLLALVIERIWPARTPAERMARQAAKERRRAAKQARKEAKRARKEAKRLKKEA